MAVSTLPYLIRPNDGVPVFFGSTRGVHKIPGALTDGRLAIVEHTLPARQLAAPIHRHSREDEISIVLAGRLGAKLGDDVVTVDAGSYLLKPRGQWHTCWNAGDDELRFSELLVPGDLEGYFDRVSRLFAISGGPSADSMQLLADEYGLQFDFHSVRVLCRDFELRF